MSVLRHSAALLIALLLTVMLQAQDNWDGVLDRYEEICGRCIELRGRISAGEAVPNAEVTKLLGELSRLRTLIQDSQGSMSAGQRKRFNTIKNRYESSTGGELSSSTPAAKKTEGTRATYKKNVTAPPAANVIRNLSVLPHGSSVPGLPFLLAAPAGTGIAAQSTPAPPEAPAPLYGPIRTDIIPIACFGVRPAFGLFGAVAKGHWGGYISARSTFTPTAADYTNATVLMLADVMNDNRVTRLKKVLSIYNQQAEQSAAGQTDLFAEGVKTKQDILDEVLVLLQQNFNHVRAD